MCTVVIRVPHTSAEPIRVLAVRDEDPTRPWNPLGRWWPEAHEGVLGVRDVRAGGAWLAAEPPRGRLSVLLNRADVTTTPEAQLRSRGGVVLDSVAGRPLPQHPPTHGFNLVEIAGATARVHTWDGDRLRTARLAPGTHMIAHDDVDDPSTPRIARWHDDFSEAELGEDREWWQPWLDILERSAGLGSTDDRAIIRDNRPHGYPTQSLLVCVAAITAEDIEIEYGELREPGQWGGLQLQ